MNKFDLKMAKFVVIMVTICIAFAVVVMHAYQYLPENNNDIDSTEEIVEEINIPHFEEKKNDRQNEEFKDVDDNEELEEQRFDDEFHKEELRKRQLEQENYEEIQDYRTYLDEANRHKEHRMYDEAIENYKKAAELADEKEQAFCYEQISTIYAIQKRYGTALSFAQKAYNTYPNTEREILLARLYYKTGNIDKATNRVNNILKRDFE